MTSALFSFVWGTKDECFDEKHKQKKLSQICFVYERLASSCQYFH
jgi:hypothetical protein